MFRSLKAWLYRNRAARNPPSIRNQQKPSFNFQESEFHFGHLVAELRDYAVFLLDHTGNVITWNAGAEQIKGYRAYEIIGQHFSRFYTAAALSSGWPTHELEVAAATGRFEDEGWRVRKNGTQFWANVVITAIRDDAGELCGFLKVTRDMTDRKQAEEKLRLSEERFRLLVDGVRDYAIFMLTAEGNVATWNTGAEITTGYKVEDVLGKHFSIFYPQDAIEHDWPNTELKHATKEGRFEDEGWRVRKDGTLFWANVVITALRSDNGVLQGFAKVTRDMTERRKADEDHSRLLAEEVARRTAESNAQEAESAREEERRQREQLLVTLNSIGDAVIVTDSAGNITFLNPIAVDLTGWSLKDATGKPLDEVFKIINEETRQKVDSPVEIVFRENRIVELANHTNIIKRDGGEVPIEDSAAPIRSIDGKVVGAILVFRDVTAARRALQDHVRLSAIVESSHDAIIGNDLDGMITSWNRGAELLYGYAANEIIGQPLSVLIPSDHPDDLSHLMEKMKHGERIDHFETVRVRKDGSRIQVSLSVSPITNEYKKVIGASKIARDITRSKRQESMLRFVADISKVLGELQDVSSAMRNLTSLAVPDFANWCAVHLIDSHDTLHKISSSSINSEVESSLEEILIGTSCASAQRIAQQVVSTSHECHAFALDDLLTKIGPEQRSLVNACKLGSFLCVPLKAKGRMLGTITFAILDTVRRFASEDLEIAKDVTHRASIAIENAQLYQKVRDADRRKDEFLAMLSHELRNPLAPIRSGLEILAMDPGPHQEALQVMQEQVEHVVRLVDDLLDVSRIVQGKIELRKVQCNLIELAKRSIDAVKSQFESRNQSFHAHLPEQAVWLDADPIRIVQVIENLLNNASKYSDQAGQISLNIHADGDEAVVTVQDNGMGIDSDLLPHVFELFTQSSRTLDRAQGGLGIGLTLVRRLTEMHNGSVTVRSGGLGKGSRFVVRLPVIEPKFDPSIETTNQVCSGPLRIAIVDDNRSAAYMLRMLLTKLGEHEVQSYSDGPTLLLTLSDFAPHVVFLDIGLPVMDGYQIASKIRQEFKMQNVLLVALTGYGQAEDRMKSSAAGFDLHIVKPPAITQILEVLSHPKILDAAF